MSRRQDLDVLAQQAEQLLRHPAFQKAFDDCRNQLISELEVTRLDGSKESEAAVLERVRDLQATIRLKTRLVQQIKTADNAAIRQDRKDKEKKIFNPTQLQDGEK